MVMETSLKKKYPDLYKFALEEFSSNTYDSASLNKILKKANMSKGSFYHNIGDKYNLYLMLISSIGAKKIELYNKIKSDDDYPKDFFDRLKVMCKISCLFIIKDPLLCNFSEQLLRESPSFIEKLYTNFSFLENNVWIKLINDAYDNDELRKDVSKNVLYVFIEGAIKNMSKVLNPELNIENYEELACKYIDILKDAVSAK